VSRRGGPFSGPPRFPRRRISFVGMLHVRDGCPMSECLRYSERKLSEESIHRGAWKRCSAHFACTGFSEVSGPL
jgi:hypothetical protein